MTRYTVEYEGGMSYRADKRLVESVGMSVSADALAFTVCGGQLVSGDEAPPEIQQMNGWTVQEVAAALRDMTKGRPAPEGDQ